ncbi:RrF2 family transcriptional regulator [Candidatus Omnitrophota bacterium]
MKLITRDTDYAIKALCCIAKRKETVVSVKDIVGCTRMPRPFSRKILQRLNKKRLLKSYRGLGGGFKLAVSPGSISLLDLIEIFQGRLSLNEHKFKGRQCPEIKACPLKRRLDLIDEHVRAELRGITISKLIKEGK